MLFYGKEINPLFSYIAHLKRDLDKKEIGTTEVNFNCADLVEAMREMSNLIKILQ